LPPLTNEDRHYSDRSPPPQRGVAASPLRGHSGSARRVMSNSAQSTANPGPGLAGESTPGYFFLPPPPWPKLLELGVRPGYRLPAPIKGPARLSVAPRTSTTISSSSSSPPSPPPAPPRTPPRAAHHRPSIRLSRAPQPKEGMGEGPPLSPSLFPPYFS
jgi:hypothetical protein